MGGAASGSTSEHGGGRTRSLHGVFFNALRWHAASATTTLKPRRRQRQGHGIYDCKKQEVPPRVYCARRLPDPAQDRLSRAPVDRARDEHDRAVLADRQKTYLHNESHVDTGQPGMDNGVTAQTKGPIRRNITRSRGVRANDRQFARRVIDAFQEAMGSATVIVLRLSRVLRRSVLP